MILSQVQISVHSSVAKAGAMVSALNEKTATIAAMRLVNLCFMVLLCDCCLINIASRWVGVMNNAGDKAHEKLGNSNDDEANEGVDDGILGLLEFARVACRGDVADAADYDEDERYNARGANEPLESVLDDASRL